MKSAALSSHAQSIRSSGATEQLFSLRPTGHLRFTLEGTALLESLGGGVRPAFSKSTAQGVVELAGMVPNQQLPAELRWWRSLGSLLLKNICADLPYDQRQPQIQKKLLALQDEAPPFPGAEYIPLVIAELWEGMINDIEAAAKALKVATVSAYVRTAYPIWAQVGRVIFHLAEKTNDERRPFAFIVTYDRTDSRGEKSVMPIGRAMQEFTTNGDQHALLAMLEPLHEAQKGCEFLSSLISSGEIFHPLALSAQEAFAILKNVAQYHKAGIVLKYPKWVGGKPQRPQLAVVIGDKKSSAVGFDGLVDFSLQVALGEKKLTKKEIEEILRAGEGLVRIKGEWVEIHHDSFSEELTHWRTIETQVQKSGLSLADAMRLLSGATNLTSFKTGNSVVGDDPETAGPRPGRWLDEVLKDLRNSAEQKTKKLVLKSLKATLRPYQVHGVQWLWGLYSLRLSGCLADDMGLGKTIQVISLLLQIKDQEKEAKKLPSLLVVPASLIANWDRELKMFAPSLSRLIAHPAETDRASLDKLSAQQLKKHDLVITTYAYLQRLPALVSTSWNCVILDEAQAIKNAGTLQAKKVKSLTSRVRFALTGTPVENRIGDLWSLFDFLSPGLLGNVTEFKRFIKQLDAGDRTNYAPLRNLVRPFILRRMKHDRSIIADLPEKTEIKTFCTLSKVQASMYSTLVGQLEKALVASDGIKRRGIILSYLQQFKQVCNHASHWSGDGSYSKTTSGKFDRLRELCGEIALQQEKVLVFTQFKEMTSPLANILEEVFERPGLILHGGTSVTKRKELVAQFSQEEGPPFFVLSLKAGGTGLNLTEASHVIHFDRWWNPAVEDQATDRAFRIGQKRNVMVHKFITRGTLEERIDQMIDTKKGLAGDIIDGGAEKVITEMSTKELIDMVSLNLQQAIN